MDEPANPPRTVPPRGRYALGPAVRGAQVRRVLVIRLGALGDFVMSFGPFAAIRRHHPDAHLTLLTTAPFVELAERSGWFDEVLVDERPRWWQVDGILRLRRTLRGGFDRVYDLQTSGRSGLYFHLLGPGPKPEWSGIARGCSHPDTNPDRRRIHTVERQAEQLAQAGIPRVDVPELSWLDAEVGRFRLGDRHALVVPGGAAHRPEKRWPAENYGKLAEQLLESDITPILIGGEADREAADIVGMHCPAAVDLVGRTSLFDVAAIARRSMFAVGNDTGPMHVIAAVGCLSVVLFSSASNPTRTAPRAPEGSGPVTVLRRDRLDDLPVGVVAEELGLV